jgi:hypothetical protein
VRPGSLLAAIKGESGWPHNVYRIYWPQCESSSWRLVSP